MKKLIVNFLLLPIYLKLTIGISLTLFIMSLTQPAFFIDRQDDPNAYTNSLILLLMGWMSLLGGAILPFVIWLANPLYFISIIFVIKRKSTGLYLSIGATLLSFIFSLLDTIMTSESGNSSVITVRGLGFKLWFASFIILTVGLLFNRILENSKSQ